MAVGADAQITDLTVDDHACLTFGEPEDLLDLTAAFVRDGLAGGLKVVWVSEAGTQRAASELTRRGIAVEPALASGQMAAADSEGCLLSGQAFSASQAIGWLSELMAACRQEGFPGLRVAVDMSWALRPVIGVEQLPDFEESVAKALAGTTVSVLCQYDRERFDPVTLATVTAFHTRSVATRSGGVSLSHTTFRPPASPSLMNAAVRSSSSSGSPNVRHAWSFTVRSVIWVSALIVIVFLVMSGPRAS